MTRPKIVLPSSFHFQCEMEVRISDINYGGHVGNHHILAFVHEARMRFLNTLDCSEKDIGEGKGLIMADAIIVFKSQAFWGDPLMIEISLSEWNPFGFDLVYRISNKKIGVE